MVAAETVVCLSQKQFFLLDRTKNTVHTLSMMLWFFVLLPRKPQSRIFGQIDTEIATLASPAMI
jgi:hypothetical protein